MLMSVDPLTFSACTIRLHLGLQLTWHTIGISISDSSLRDVGGGGCRRGRRGRVFRSRCGTRNDGGMGVFGTCEFGNDHVGGYVCRFE